MEKARAANIVSDFILAKHVDVEVLSQAEAKWKAVVDILIGEDIHQSSFHAAQLVSSRDTLQAAHPKRLFRLSDAIGTLSFNLVKDDQLMEQRI
jgi:gelsolin